jgi:hypothetical protein
MFLYGLAQRLPTLFDTPLLGEIGQFVPLVDNAGKEILSCVVSIRVRLN